MIHPTVGWSYYRYSQPGDIRSMIDFRTLSHKCNVFITHFLSGLGNYAGEEAEILLRASRAGWY